MAPALRLALVTDDAAFLAAFEAAAIPRANWKHADHIRMAFLYLRDLPFDEAVARIRSGLHALNRANEIPENETSSYHETVTVAWAHVVASAIAHHGPTVDFATFAEANPHLLTKTLLRLYYTRERVFGTDAKTRFVEPDLAPFPR